MHGNMNVKSIKARHVTDGTNKVQHW